MSQQDHFQAPALEHLAELLPAFDIEAFIAKGGMGAVYLARQRSLDRQVAIKVLPRELGADPEFRKSFETEAKAMARLNHPNLIGVFDYGDVDGMPYIVMEYVDGNSLYHSAWGQTIDPEQSVSLIRRICEGLGHAHEHGIIHRDIKPANILLNSKAEPKIGDFGLAIPTDSDGPGLVMGTPGYSAPEFLQNPATSDHRADIYAVGVILHELLTAERPDPEYQKPFKPCGDPKLDAIWKKATAPDPAHRYQTAEAMAADLAAWKPSPASRLITSAAAGPRVPRPAAPTTTARPVIGPARPAAGAVPPRSTVVMPKKSTTGRNVAVILILLATIGVVSVLLNKETAKRDAHNDNVSQTNAEKREAAKRELERQRAKAEADRLAAAGGEAETTTDTHPDETPLESLARLQERLRHGFRSELPKGSVRHGDADFLLVKEPMTWSAASLFAEQHGAFLGMSLGSLESVAAGRIDTLRLVTS